MTGTKTSIMTGIKCLQHINCFGSANFPDNDAIW